MARLPDETAIRGTDPRSVDSVVVGAPDPIGGAASAFASGVQQFASGIGKAANAIGEQQSDADRYNAENELIKLEKDHRRFLDEQKSKTDGDPAGFAENNRKAFDARADSIYRSAPARLQPIIKNRLQAMDGAFNNEASNFENTRRDSYFGKQVSDNLDGIRADIASDPSKHAEIRQRGLDLIDASPLSAGVKDKLREAWKSGAATSAIAAALQRDPEGTRAALGFGAASSVTDRINRVESGNDPNAKNPNSTATGLGQFIEGTWMSFLREVHPELAKDREDGLSLRTDPKLAREATDWYARKNARELRAAGFPDTPGNIYLAHFAGPGGAKAILGADPAASVNSVLGQDAVAANPFLAGKTVGWVRDWANAKMAGVKMDPTASYAQDITEEQRQGYGRQGDRLYAAQQAARIAEIEAQQQRAAAEAQATADRIKAEQRAAASQIKRDMADDLASIERSGQGLDPTRLNREKVAGALGEEAAIGWEGARTRSLRVNGAMKGIENLSDQDMDERLKRLEPVPGAAGFEADQEAYNAAEKRIDRIRKARSADPALAVEALEPVKEAKKQAKFTVDEKGTRTISPESAQAVIRARLEAQADLGIRAPLAVTRSEAREMSRTLRSIGEDNPEALEGFMRKLRGTYGKYADDVLSSVLQLQGVNKDLSNVATEVLSNVAMSIPPTPDQMRRLSNAADDAAMGNAMQGRAAPAPARREPIYAPMSDPMTGFTTETMAPTDRPAAPLRPGNEVGGTLVQYRPDGTRVNYVKELLEGRVSDFDFDTLFNAGDGESASAKIRRQYAMRTRGEAQAQGAYARGGQ